MTEQDLIQAPHRYDAIYEKMRQSEMNGWVGGADPKLAGIFTVAALLQRLSIGPHSKVLDFGCGIGRVALELLGRDNRAAHYVGFDIVPALVDFCRTEIAPFCPNTTFELIEGDNSHYDHFKQGVTPPRSREALTGEYGGQFTHAFAISVFTHLDAEQFQRELRFVASLLDDGAQFMFTAFTLTPFSRRQMTIGSQFFNFDTAEYRDDGQVMVGNPADPLAFIAYDRSLIERYVDEAGLIICNVDYGQWMGGDTGNSLQDHYVCRKPLRRTAG